MAEGYHKKINQIQQFLFAGLTPLILHVLADLAMGTLPN